MKIPENVIAALRQEGTFLVASHIGPDGDALGSSLALSLALESLGKKTFVYNRDSVPAYYRYLPGSGKILSDLERVMPLRPVLVLLDCNSPERASLENVSFRKAIVVDHHETEKDYGDLRWVDHAAAATGMMVYYILKALGAEITADIASNLYTAIAVDTGTFRYSNTSSGVLRVCAELIDSGARPDRIAVSLYESWEEKRFNLFILTMNTLEMEGDVAIVHVTEEMFRKTGTKAEDTETFSNFPRMIDTVKASVLFREVNEGEWKVSLRSKGDVNVAKIAELFGGGGHKNAAGYRTKADLKTAKSALLGAFGKIR